MKKYELVDHTADVGLKIFGESPEELFQNAGFALFDLITDITSVTPRHRRRFRLERDSLEELLVEWLSSLLYVFDTELILFGSFSVLEMNEKSLVADAGGEPFREADHSIKTPVKAVTYHCLNINKQGGIWTATVILDI